MLNDILHKYFIPDLANLVKEYLDIFKIQDDYIRILENKYIKEIWERKNKLSEDMKQYLYHSKDIKNIMFNTDGRVLTEYQKQVLGQCFEWNAERYGIGVKETTISDVMKEPKLVRGIYNGKTGDGYVILIYFASYGGHHIREWDIAKCLKDMFHCDWKMRRYTTRSSVFYPVLSE